MNPTVAYFIAQASSTATSEGSAEGSAEAATGVQSMLETVNVGLIVGMVVLVLAVWIILKMVSSAANMSKYGAGLAPSVRRQVKTLQDSNNGRQAADLLFEHGAFADAAEVYAQANDYLRAGEASERAGNTAKAVQFYRRGGAAQMAAEAYVRRGQFQLAAKEFEATDAHEKAAECYVKANDFRKAAELYEKLQRHKEAGEQFERLNDDENAARLYKRHFDIQYDIARGDVRNIKEAYELASKAAGYFEKLGRQVEAAELLRKAGFLRRAAEMYTSIGKIEEAAKIYVDARKPEYAARLYDSVGESQKAIRFRAEAKLASGDKVGAAEDFEAAGEFFRAAELFVDVGARIRAAENFERAEDFRLAAEYYNLGEQRARAAEMYEKAGDFDSAADLYRAEGDFRSELRVAKAGNDFYRVGEILLEHTRLEDALAAFQRVDQNDPRYDSSCILQGDILRKLGRLDVAFQKYREAVGDQKPNKGNVDLLYKMAETAEEGNNLVQALQLFESVIGVDYYYRDANDRATAVRQKIAAQGSQAGFNMTGIGYAVAPGMIPPGAPGAAPPQPAKPRRYEVVDEVARGGMGVVYRARDTVLDRVVAYKLLSANLKGNDVAVKYFLREARAAAQMSHVNIVTVFDAGEQDGEYFMAMEFVEGQTLKQLITRQGAFPEKLVRYVMAHVCRGLAYAHDRGLVHRDVKPGNIMLTRDRTVKIMDFGLAKFVEEVQAQHTRAIGTPYYMSPEQILGKELDGRSDIYSLGVSMFECATGQVPFSKGDLSYHHLHTEPPAVQELNPKISDELAAIIHKCMAKNPDDRYRSAVELAAVVKP